MNNNKEPRFYEKIEYNIDQAAQCEKTENSDDKRRTDKKRLTKSSTEADTENKTDNREETEPQETPNFNQRMTIEVEVIPNSNASQNNGDALNNENQIINLSKNRAQKKKPNSPESQTHETTDTKVKPKIIFRVIKGNIPPEEKHSRLTNDNLNIKVCRMAMKSIFDLLKYRCERENLVIEEVDPADLFGNIHKQRWFVKRKIKYIFASKHANKEVIIKMIKKDKVFRKLVNLKFEEFYNNYFIINNKFLRKNKGTLMLLSHLNTFKYFLEKEKKKEKEKKEHTEKEIEEYIEKLNKTGINFINEINGRGFYQPRCNRKKIRTKICFIRYK